MHDQVKSALDSIGRLCQCVLPVPKISLAAFKLALEHEIKEKQRCLALRYAGS